MTPEESRQTMVTDRPCTYGVPGSTMGGLSYHTVPQQADRQLVVVVGRARKRGDENTVGMFTQC
jgi:hypothetical protein